MTINTLIDEWKQLSPIEWCQNPYGWILPDGEPITLAPWQRSILSEYWQRKDDISTLFISCPKKSGKTALNAILTAYRWLVQPGVHFCLGNDWDQAAMLQSAMISEMCQRHPVLKRYVKVNKSELIFTPTNSRLITLPADYAGSSGHNFLTVSLTEVWAFTYESHIRLYEELTPPPLVGALRVVDSYAGYTSESLLLERVWNRGLSGEKIGEDLTLAGQQLSFIATGETGHKRTWRGTEKERQAYLTEQRETLRPGTFDRLHNNFWASAEDTFIQPEQWDALIQPGYVCPSPDKSVRLYAGIDAAVKHDNAACVTVWKKDGLLHLGPFRIWKPTPTIDLEAIENYVLDLSDKFNLISCVFDPYQMAHLSQRLSKRKINMVEFPQSIPNLTVCGNLLYDLITQGRFVSYNAPELRAHVLAAHGKETPRGVRLIKGDTSRKIDAAIALAMSCVTADQDKPRWRHIDFMSVSGGGERAIRDRCPQCKRILRDDGACVYCGYVRTASYTPLRIL